MRSIRRSLTLYFLALLGVGLGAVAVLTDRLMEQTLQAREKAEAEAIGLRADEQSREERERFERELREQARALGREIWARYETEPRRFQAALVAPVFGLGTVGGLGPVIWTAGITPGRRQWLGPVGGTLAREYFTHLQSSEHFVRPADEEDRHPHFTQINGASGRVWRSDGLGSVGFPLNPQDWDPTQRVEDRIGDVTLPDGQPGRLAVHKMTLARGGGLFFPRGDRERSGRPPGPPPGPPPDRDAVPFVFIHYARPTAELDARLGPIQARADREMENMVSATAGARTELRLWVAGVGLATFLGIVLGGPTLIRHGLRPLRKLSDAVSRVSEKDFRLPVERDELSHELLPIHARLTDTLDDLRRAFEREKQAVADISHELRTPVAGLLATIDVTLRKPRSADQYRTALEESRAIGRQLAGLVERVMTLATLDAGADRTEVIETDAAEVADGCAAVVRPLAVANGIRFSADLPRPVPVTTDPDKLREVVTNLLHNAVEYNRPGGTIRLAVRATPGGGAEVEVADTGIGMTPDVRDKIFERFYRADASRHAAGAHAGLGLSIVKEYVQRLGGAITVESEAGVGSTFRVTLPAAPAGAERVMEPEPMAAGV